MTKANQVRDLFQDRMGQLQSWLRHRGLPPELAGLPVDRLLQTRLVWDEPPSDYFHFHPRESWFGVSQRFCETWNRHTGAKGLTGLDRDGVFDTFLVHEWAHLNHGLTSDKYFDLADDLQGLRRLDYRADAISVLVCEEMYRSLNMLKECPSGPRLRARVIRMALTNMEVFDAFWTPYPLEEMEVARFNRYLTWHFQHARAAQWPRTGRSLDLLEEPLIEPEWPGQKVSLWEAPPRHLKLFITGDGRLNRFRADSEAFAKRLIRGVLSGDVRMTGQAFDEVFGLLPGLVGG